MSEQETNSYKACLQLVFSAVMKIPVGSTLNVNALRTQFELAGMSVPNGNFWGNAMKSMAKLGIIRKTGTWIRSRRKSANRRLVLEWERC